MAEEKEITYEERADTLSDYIIAHHKKGWGDARQRAVMTDIIITLRRLHNEGE